MPFNDYYEDELAFLQELGRDFARENPKLAPFLAHPQADPDVERLLEGFAFLSGRLRQKLDDEFPEITHSLFALLWPHFLRPLPSMSVVSFEPVPNAISERKTIGKGVEVDSVPVDGTSCRFRTCYDVDLYPLSLESVALQHTAAGSVLQIDLGLSQGITLDAVDLTTLRLYLQGHPARTLYLWLSRHLERIVVKPLSGDSGDTQRGFVLPPGAIRPAGFDGEEALLPYPPNAWSGYRLLQEYFALPEKFLFVDVTGLEPLARQGWTGRFRMEFQLRRAMDEQLRVTKDNVHLYCTPVVNLFAHDGDPIRLDHKKVEYRVRPAGKEPWHHEVYSIDKVTGLLHGSGQRRAYRPFEAFDHTVEQKGDLSTPIYYRTRLRPAVIGRGIEAYIAFVSGTGYQERPSDETISLELTCTNRQLAGKLRPGDICRASGSSPEFARFRNVSRVTPAVPPPLDRALDWQLVSNLSLNYGSLTNVDALRHIIATYDFHALYDAQAERERDARLEGIVAAETEPLELLFQGLPLRGLHTRLTLREGKLGGEGDMYLFASVLNAFFALYANINSFHQLLVKGIDKGNVYEWPPITGQQSLR